MLRHIRSTQQRWMCYRSSQSHSTMLWNVISGSGIQGLYLYKCTRFWGERIRRKKGSRYELQEPHTSPMNFKAQINWMKDQMTLHGQALGLLRVTEYLRAGPSRRQECLRHHLNERGPDLVSNSRTPHRYRLPRKEHWALLLESSTIPFPIKQTSTLLRLLSNLETRFDSFLYDFTLHMSLSTSGRQLKGMHPLPLCFALAHRADLYLNDDRALSSIPWFGVLPCI